MTETHIQYMLSKIPMGRFFRKRRGDRGARVLARFADCSFSNRPVFDISAAATYK